MRDRVAVHGSRTVPEHVRRLIVRDYARGEKIDAIAEAYGVDRSYPRKLAAQRGVPARRPQERASA